MTIHGMTDEMRKFDLKPPGSVAGTGGGVSASGGMPEGAEFAKAEAAAAELLGKFLAEVQGGFAAYTNVVQESASDYLRADRSGAQALPHETQPEIPMMVPGGY